MNLSWQDKSSNETGFKVYRKSGVGPWLELASLEKGTRHYTDLTASGNATTNLYAYYVKACNATGCSPGTAEAALPLAPSNPAVETSWGTVDLSWQDNSDNESYFEIERKAGLCSSSKAWGPPVQADANTTTFRLSLPAGVHAFRMRAALQSLENPAAIGMSNWTDRADADVLPVSSRLKWKYNTGGSIYYSSPAIAADGTVYIGAKASDTEPGFLLALDAGGNFKWKYEAEQAGQDIYYSPAIGADGPVYIGAESSYLYALNPAGELVWKYSTGNGINWTSPAIADDGTIYIGNNNGELFALRSTSPGLADTSWPRFRHDNQSTGRHP